jgi:hypothetical protein
MAEDTTPDKGITSPPDPTHEATTPPGNGDLDQDALKKAEEGLETPGGGH